MRYIKYFLFIVLLQSCSGSDSSKELGSEYWLNIEGKGVNEIFTRSLNKKGIPPDIIKYAYNKDFIFAEQRPKEFDDIIHDDDIVNYKFGRNALYYWIILKESGLRIGPLNEFEFKTARKKYNVPENLQLKPVY